MSRRRPPDLHPLRQGDLDCLCGVYAIVNAVRLAVGRNGGLNREDWQELFHELVSAIDRKGTTFAALTWGLDPKPVWGLSKVAATHLVEAHDVAVRVSRPLRGKGKLDHDQIIDWLRDQTSRPRAAVMVGLGGAWDHWTVVRSVGSRFVSLYDSCSVVRISTGAHRGAEDGAGSTLAKSSVILFEATTD